MKRFLFFLILVNCCQYIKAQVNINPDFYINSGNNTNTPCPTFLPGSVPGWDRTHGTPSFVSGDVLYFYSVDQNGDGISTPYTFQQNATYKIRVGYKKGYANDGFIALRATTSQPSGSVFVFCQ